MSTLGTPTNANDNITVQPPGADYVDGLAGNDVLTIDWSTLTNDIRFVGGWNNREFTDDSFGTVGFVNFESVTFKGGSGSDDLRTTDGNDHARERGTRGTDRHLARATQRATPTRRQLDRDRTAVARLRLARQRDRIGGLAGAQLARQIDASARTCALDGTIDPRTRPRALDHVVISLERSLIA
mgnify:CR=1 FL=1